MAQVRPEGLSAALSRAVPAIGWIHGDEPLLVQEAAGLFRAAARRAGADERQVFEVDRSFKAERFAAEAGALSLFASGRLLELRFSGKPGKEYGELIAITAEQADASLRLLVLSGRLDRSTTETGWFGRIDRAGLVVPVFPVERRELPRWIAGRLARQKQRADAATLELIAERVEGNLLAAHQEVSKLGLLFPEGEIPAAEARAAVLSVARYDAFDLVEAMLAGDRERSLRSLEGLRAEGEAPPLLVWAIGDAIRTLMRLHAARDQGLALAQAMRSARIFGPRERLFEAAMRRVSAADCEQALRSTALADRIFKGVAAGDSWLTLERIVMRMAGVPLPGDN
ncbi:MAG: DNA polymerase III subunit delta [Betaproteobacteria bacterium]